MNARRLYPVILLSAGLMYGLGALAGADDEPTPQSSSKSKASKSDESKSKAETFSIDPTHSMAMFRVRHGASMFWGRFNKITGTVRYIPDNETGLELDITMAIDSVDSGSEKLPAHLKSEDREDLGGPVFEIEGEDSGLLIGRRGDTLKSLQFLVKFLVSKRLGTRANMMIDVEGYQERRYNSLTNLAQRVGQRVASTGRAVTLEPMPPNERRIVHLALADHPDVTTESMGEGDGRQVVVQAK